MANLFPITSHVESERLVLALFKRAVKRDWLTANRRGV